MSAPASFAGEHRLSVQPRDADGKPVAPAGEAALRLVANFSGRVNGGQIFHLAGIPFPGIGDYSLEVLADGQPVGSIDFFAREARFGPMKSPGS